MREIRSISIRPGLLVNLSSRLKGGVEYEREELDHEVLEKTDISSWKTERKIADIEELRLGSQAQSRVRSLIRSACTWTPFGNICPADQEEVLRERITAAEAVRDAFNATSVHSKVHFSILTGRIAENSREAVTAVRDEIRALLGELNSSLASGSVEEIRAVASRATQMGKLLEDGTEARTALQRAVKESRRIATELVKRVTEGADAVAEVLAGTDQKIIGAAIHTFDEEDTGEIEPESEQGLPGVALSRFGGLGEEYIPPSVPDYTVAERALFDALYGAVSPFAYFAAHQDEPGLEARVRAQLDFEAGRRQLPEGWETWTAEVLAAFVPGELVVPAADPEQQQEGAEHEENVTEEPNGESEEPGAEPELTAGGPPPLPAEEYDQDEIA